MGKERDIRRKDKPLTSQSLKRPSLLLFPVACACASCRSSNEGQRSRISDKAPKHLPRVTLAEPRDGYGSLGPGPPTTKASAPCRADWPSSSDRPAGAAGS